LPAFQYADWNDANQASRTTDEIKLSGTPAQIPWASELDCRDNNYVVQNYRKNASVGTVDYGSVCF
jgi:hypothetical protein